MKNEDFDENIDDEFDSSNNLNIIEDLKNSLPNFHSEKLCQIIVCDRYFGYNKEIAILCMEELSTRRQFGDMFEFEDYIEKELIKLPVLDFSIPDLRTVLGEVIKVKK